MLLRYQIKFEDFKELQKIQMIRKKKIIIIVTAFYGIIFLGISYKFWWYLIIQKKISLIVLVSYLISILFPLVVYFFILKQWISFYNKIEKFLKNIECELTKNRLVYKSRRGKFVLKRKDILEVRQNKKIYAFIQSDKRAVIIPKRDINDKEGFRKILNKFNF